MLCLGPCASNPCGDYGICYETDFMVDDLNYLCECEPDYTGDNCQTLIYTGKYVGKQAIQLVVISNAVKCVKDTC